MNRRSSLAPHCAPALLHQNLGSRSEFAAARMHDRRFKLGNQINMKKGIKVLKMGFSRTHLLIANILQSVGHDCDSHLKFGVEVETYRVFSRKQAPTSKIHNLKIILPIAILFSRIVVKFHYLSNF